MTHYLYADCPHCDGQIEVGIEAEPGEKEIRYPNDRAYPGSPPEVRVVDEGDRSGCECEEIDWQRLEEENYERFLEHAEEAMQAQEDAYYDRKLRESKLEDL